MPDGAEHTEDPDDHSDSVIVTVRMVSQSNAGLLRRLAFEARRHPNLTPSQALLDAADGIERAAAQFLARMGQ